MQIPLGKTIQIEELKLLVNLNNNDVISTVGVVVLPIVFLGTAVRISLFVGKTLP